MKPRNQILSTTNSRSGKGTYSTFDNKRVLTSSIPFSDNRTCNRIDIVNNEEKD
jgi:hypothetical protein